MATHLFDEDGLLKSRVYYDSDEDKMIRYAWQDCEPIIEENLRKQSEFTRFGNDHDIHHVASIPMTVVLEWLNHSGLNILGDPDAFDYVCRKMLNSSEYQHLRSIPGRI